MKYGIRNVWIALSVFALAATLVGCAKENTEEKKPQEILSITVTDPNSDLSELESYPKLQSADLRGCENYEQILLYIQQHPEVSVVYDVTLGEQSYAQDVTELTFTAGEVPYDDLLARLQYLPGVTKITLPETDLTAEQISALVQACPATAVEHTVSIDGTLYGADTTKLDLSWMKPEQIVENLDKLALLFNLQEVELMDENGTSLLALPDVKTLQDALPQVFFHYSFDLFGKTVSTSDEVIEYDSVYIGNSGEERIRQALDILTKCTYFKLDDCGLDNEVMSGIREDYPNIKVVWRIHISPYSMLTDETMLRLTFCLNDDNVSELKYLNDVTYMDIGHNDTLTDISFVAYMPKLECVIVSGAPIQDISAFKNCKNLEWLELCFCSWVKDLSVLEEIPNLKYLNVSYSQVSDLTPLENVKLERFNCLHTKVDAAMEASFVEKHPDCLSVFEGKQPYGYGWRYNDYGYTFFEYYANMRIVFRYDDKNFFGNGKER